MNITSEAISGGHAIYRDTIYKLAVVTTSHHMGLYRDGLGVHEPIPRLLWNIHWTKPAMEVEEARAVIDYIATLPVAPSP